MKQKSIYDFILLKGNRDYHLYKNDIQQENKKSFILFLIANFITQSAVLLSRIALNRNLYLFSLSLAGTLYSLLLLLIIPSFIKKIPSKAVLPLLYAIQVPSFIISIFNGCVFIGDSYAFSFYILSFILPLFIFDMPLRVISIQTLYCVIFIIVDYFFKSSDIFAIDIVHLLVTYSGIISAILLILSLRYANLENYIAVREKSEHHEVTGLKNKYALKKESKNFLHRDMIVSMIDIDDFKFFNDMYGHQVGDIVLKEFGKILINNFGASSCFSYGGDEFLIAYPSTDTHEFTSLLEKTKKDLRNLTISESVILHPTFSAGFVHGKPLTNQQFQEMINSADFTLYNSKDQGKNTINEGLSLSSKPLTTALEKREVKMSSSLDPLTKTMTFQSYVQYGERYRIELCEQKNMLICHINILNFKIYNSTFDYEAGDELLVKVAEILKKHFPLSIISRISADHFSLICKEEDFVPSFEEAAKEFLSDTKNPGIKLICGCVRLTDNMNIRQGNDLSKIACDSVKKERGTDYRFYDQALSIKSENTKWILSNFSDALARKDILIYYQPIVQTLSSSISSLEALARWKHPKKGIIPPGDFISVLEENRLISKLDLYILENVCRQDQILMKEGKYVLPISINLSRFDFENPNLSDEIIAIVDKYEIPHELIILEITESTFLTEKEILQHAVKKLKDASFKIWMDDFGSEYSSLNLLKEFQFDVIKLDMNFLPSEHEKKKGRTIIDSIIEMAQKLSIRTLTEGVENEDDYLFLKNTGCEFVQGYLISKPLPIDQLDTFLHNQVSYIPSSKEEIEYYQTLNDLTLQSMKIDKKTLDLSKKFNRAGIAIVEYKDGQLQILKSDSVFREFLNKNNRNEFLGSNLFSSSWHPIEHEFINGLLTSYNEHIWVKKDCSMNDGTILYLYPIMRNPTSQAESFLLLAEVLPEKDRNVSKD